MEIQFYFGFSHTYRWTTHMNMIAWIYNLQYYFIFRWLNATKKHLKCDECRLIMWEDITLKSHKNNQAQTAREGSSEKGIARPTSNPYWGVCEWLLHSDQYYQK